MDATTAQRHNGTHTQADVNHPPNTHTQGRTHPPPPHGKHAPNQPTTQSTTHDPPEIFRNSAPASPVPQPASITRHPCPLRFDGRKGLPAGEAMYRSTALFLVRGLCVGVGVERGKRMGDDSYLPSSLCCCLHSRTDASSTTRKHTPSQQLGGLVLQCMKGRVKGGGVGVEELRQIVQGGPVQLLALYMFVRWAGRTMSGPTVWAFIMRLS